MGRTAKRQAASYIWGAPCMAERRYYYLETYSRLVKHTGAYSLMCGSSEGMM